MRLALLALVVTMATACASATNQPASAPIKPTTKQEDRHEARTASAAEIHVDVSVAGAVTTWKREAFDRTPKFAGANTAKDGDARNTWSLRELVHVLVGPNARAVSVVGADETKTIERSAWEDSTQTPILHTTRRGTLKFRWSDAQGNWNDTNIRDVKRIEIEP